MDGCSFGKPRRRLSRLPRAGDARHHHPGPAELNWHCESWHAMTSTTTQRWDETCRLQSPRTTPAAPPGQARGSLLLLLLRTINLQRRARTGNYLQTQIRIASRHNKFRDSLYPTLWITIYWIENKKDRLDAGGDLWASCSLHETQIAETGTRRWSVSASTYSIKSSAIAVGLRDACQLKFCQLVPGTWSRSRRLVGDVPLICSATVKYYAKICIVIS